MLNFERDNDRLNVRSAAVIIHESHVLLHKDKNTDFWTLPGGRVEFFEHSDTTLVREMKEELGFDLQVTRPLWYMENFFTYHQKKCHEISTYYLAEFTDPWVINLQEDIKGIEAEIDLIFRWFPIADLPSHNIKPNFLISGLQSIPEQVVFIRNNEIAD
ncbi:NUDIX hydrolase [Veronia pacifica]|uniref:NTP pyrophosphohydrolase n=1 Tax=Veronia pacifica TaxID=1080227 RepID=A0A1C3EAN0_9GAMM|nr:NUDIX hydrolase [Veronia pacifica]ODA30306.1 NTP pyrophosphohydrolase [Veronia pacifica]